MTIYRASKILFGGKTKRKKKEKKDWEEQREDRICLHFIHFDGVALVGLK
jgi:hypothetical protein